MLSHANGTGATPGTMASFLNANNYWAGDCLMDWPKVLYYPGNSMQWGGTSNFTTAIAKQQIDNDDPFIVFVLLPGGQTHFVVGYGYENNGALVSDYLVLDPLKDNPTRLNTYNIQNLRLFNNVIQNSQMTFTFKINNTLLPPPPNSWKLYKYPPIPPTFYNLEINAQNLGANTYDVYLERPDGALTDMAQNLANGVHTQPFNVSASDPWFPNSGNYRIKIFKNADPPHSELWATSQPFYISVPPQVHINDVPNVLHAGETINLTISITGGIPALPYGGWDSIMQIQQHRGGTPLNAWFPPVSTTSFPYTVPSTLGDSFRVSVSNPPGSSIPPGYIFDYTNYYTIINPIGITPISEAIPAVYALYDNYPNPFNPVTTIKFDIPHYRHTVLEVFSVLGTKVATLVNESLTAGRYEITFDTGNLASGIYFYKITSNDFIASKKMVLMK